MNYNLEDWLLLLTHADGDKAIDLVEQLQLENVDTDLNRVRAEAVREAALQCVLCASGEYQDLMDYANKLEGEQQCPNSQKKK